MNEANASQPSGNLFVALLGLCIPPLVLIVDTSIAAWRGWSLTARGNYGDFILASMIALLALIATFFLIALLIGPLRRWMRREATRLFALGVSLMVGWGLAEMLLWYVAPQPPFHLRPPEAKYIYQPDPFTMAQVSGEAHSTYNSLGLRGPELPPRDEARRILCVGGSTTECYYLDDTEAWPALLAKSASRDSGSDVWVGVAAVSEYAVAQHRRFIESSPLLDEVDSVIVLAGANDLMRYIIGFDDGTHVPPLWYRSGLIAIVRMFWNMPEEAVDAPADNIWGSILASLAGLLPTNEDDAAATARGFVVDSTGEDLDLQRLGMEINEPEEPLDIAAAAKAYGARVRHLCEAAKARGVRLVLVTQPVLWRDFLSKQGERRLNYARVEPLPRPWSFLEAPNLADAMAQFNEELIEVAEDTGTDYVDAAAEMNGEIDYFYDDYHLNEHGCAQLADLLAEWYAANGDGS